MRLSVAVVSALLLTGAAPALAQTPAQSPHSQPQPTRVSTAQPQRVVLICDADAATRSAFAREYGAEPVFLTAREAAEARATGQAWTTPRCMTEREHGRYLQLTQAYAAR